MQGVNTVDVVIADNAGQPASPALVKSVQDYIDPDSEGAGRGQAPIGAQSVSYTHLAAQADESLYTADNYNAICDLLGFAPYQAHVFRCDSDGALADTLTEISKTVKTGWLTIAGQSAADGLALAAWVKTQDNTKKKTYKAVCYDLTTLPDDMHVVNFINEKVTFSDDRGEKDGVAYLPSLVGIFAVCNVTRGSTNYQCSNLSEVQEVEDNDAALGTCLLYTSRRENVLSSAWSAKPRKHRHRRVKTGLSSTPVWY